MVSTDKEYENIYSGLVSPDNDVYNTLQQATNTTQRAQKKGRPRHCCTPCRLTSVCLGLLSVFLLAAIVSLCLYYNGVLPHKCGAANSSMILSELERLKANNRNLTELGVQLRREKDVVEGDRNTLRRQLTSAKKETENVKKENSQLRSQVHEKQKSIDDLTAKLANIKHCPGDFLPFKSSCYYFSRAKKSWTDSRKDCKARRADLVKIESQGEQEFLHYHCKSEYYWIGLTDSAIEGTWMWVDDSRLSVGYWEDGEPNNWENRNEDCVHGFKKEDPLKSWNDAACHEHWFYICETKPQ
ncbi:CD209 antigen-like protein C [Megalops cyprinoides]|uniref:CD209 antigen-like protein C n=1 Tax=Megalops cyprinoides TaxID=118141 RepID=UPI001864D9B4|nr:CD209 antigen-like protein C [Megalops cyprinoides]